MVADSLESNTDRIDSVVWRILRESNWPLYKPVGLTMIIRPQTKKGTVWDSSNKISQYHYTSSAGQNEFVHIVQRDFSLSFLRSFSIQSCLQFYWSINSCKLTCLHAHRCMLMFREITQGQWVYIYIYSYRDILTNACKYIYIYIIFVLWQFTSK